MTKLYWQNLAYLKCPKCHSRLSEREIGFDCPDNPTCKFSITRRSLVNILTDPGHPAVMYLASGMEEELNKTLVRAGIIELQSGQRIW